MNRSCGLSACGERNRAIEFLFLCDEASLRSRSVYVSLIRMTCVDPPAAASQYLFSRLFNIGQQR